ncbi:MAG: D-alanyl-D-alanine carboxypeptidase family protein [Methylocystis sp.]|uniref:D-alanyl-D-alanine carboxypeptidase family protein n=1 Tax=Methylocystis sp. TaxID=1911079 RepID=UPI003DA47B05
MRDANSGRTLFARNENELRYPASITKVMTLYLLFEQLERKCLQLDSPIKISSHAAAQAPSKIGLPRGQTIDVRSAIEAVVTKSANDVAAAIAEEIGGDEQTFARMMTAKAHAIGMSRTYFSNASGLPSKGQVTTAKDLATLGEAIQERFPNYFGFFSTRHFAYRGHVYRNHNHLLGKLNGMDGIKTGFIRASGYNLLASVRRNRRTLIAVILGGRTAASRDQAMARLIGSNIGKASPVRTAAAIAPKAYTQSTPSSQNCEIGTSPDARADTNNASALGRE